MGFLKAITGGIGGVLADQWVDYFKCESLSMNVLVHKGEKFVSNRSSNTKASDDVITNGSRVDVADGQCVLIVENGKIVDFCNEPGQYTYKTDLEPSMLSGGWKGLADSFRQVGQRFTAGGQQLHAQYVFYVNTKELMGNKWGVGEVPFRDSEFNFTMKISAYGEYSYRLTDPILFYTNVAGNVSGDFTRDRIDSQLKAELQTAMQPALGRIALQKIAYDQLPLFTKNICDELNAELTENWVQKRGLSIVSFAVASVTPDGESAKKIEMFQESRVYTNPGMMGARIGAAQANAMESAAQNEAGAMTGFMGMGFAQNAGGANAAQLFQMGQQQDQTAQPAVTQPAVTQPAVTQSGTGWTCACGATEQSGKFCSECGKPKPAACPNCGWKPADGQPMPKFCPECGQKQ